MAFTDHEKARIRHFLSYPSWSSLAQSIQLGYPAASQPAFLLDDAFRRMTPGGEESIRQDLCECEGIERQISEARSRMKATKLGNLQVNPEETIMLRRELMHWVSRLASDLGVQPNPYSNFEYNGMGGGGYNARVVGGDD